MQMMWSSWRTASRILMLVRDVQFSSVSSAKVSWDKSEALKYSGVFLGDPLFVLNNWENVLEKVKGGLTRWMWTETKMS